MPSHEPNVSAEPRGTGVAGVKCPHCRKGPRILSQYQYAGMMHDDYYCGHCGRNWPDSGKWTQHTETV
jgi:hypothetical protein